ncbi:MAG: hypothetical protein J6Z01_00530 [Bacteroidales bacterium]|nr:hypothetical protein [Bacteroidales bacterium]
MPAPLRSAIFIRSLTQDFKNNAYVPTTGAQRTAPPPRLHIPTHPTLYFRLSGRKV